jgi:hypothetical protein
MEVVRQCRALLTWAFKLLFDLGPVGGQREGAARPRVLELVEHLAPGCDRLVTGPIA